MKDKEYFFALNGWRIVFSLLIVWHHLPADWKTNSINYDFGNTIVLFFFILSGFLLTLGYQKKIVDGKIKYKDFVIKRAIAVFPIQWLMTLLFVFFGINIVTYWAVPFNLTLTQSLVPFWEINWKLNTPAWFLSSIFICYLLTPPVLLFAKKRVNFVIIYCAVVLIWNIFVFLLPDNIGGRLWLCYINPFARFIDFSAGILLALYWPEIKKIFNGILKNKAIATFCEVMIVAVVSYLFVDESIQEYNNYRVLRYPVILFFIVVFALSSGLVSKFLGSEKLNKLGDLSLAIYMCHSFILYFTKKIEFGSTDINICATYIFTLLFSYVIVRYYTPFMQKLLTRIFTKKNSNA